MCFCWGEGILSFLDCHLFFVFLVLFFSCDVFLLSPNHGLAKLLSVWLPVFSHSVHSFLSLIHSCHFCVNDFNNLFPFTCVIGNHKGVLKWTYSKNSLPSNIAAASNDITDFLVIQPIALLTTQMLITSFVLMISLWSNFVSLLQFYCLCFL